MQVLLQIDAYDPVAAGTITLYACSHDDPAVCHANNGTWWPTIAKLPTLRYDLFDGAFGNAITAPSSSLTLQVEAWPNFGRYSFADARLRLWTGDTTDPANVWTLRFDGRVSAQPQIDNGAAQIDFAVDDRWLDKPLLATYAGTTGAEGPLAMKGQTKPLALGAPRYVPGKLIDSVNSVFQISSYGAMQSIDTALEKLARFGAAIADYASYAALIAANVPAGQWATAKAVGMARFGAPPNGQISFLVGGDAAGTDGWARKPGQLIRRLAILCGGAGKIDDASLNALDVARPYNLSLYVDDQATARDLIQKLAASVNAVAGVSWTGQLFVAPVGLGAPTVTLSADGSTLPPVASVQQVDIASPWQKLAVGAERAWMVHALGDIAFTAPLLPLGLYSSTTIYREGNIVDLADGSSFLYINTTPASGHAPPAGTFPPAAPANDAYWYQQKPPTSLTAIGFTGDSDAQRNSRIAVTGGQITGIGTGNGSSVDNGYITVSAGTINGIGTGSGTAVGNSLISIGSNGALAGGGGGQVTIGGLGFTGDTDAQRNSRITIDGTGTLTGIGTSSIIVQNSKITVSAGTLQGIGTGNGTAVGNSLISIGSNGALAGGGGGQVTIGGLGYAGDLNATADLTLVGATGYTANTSIKGNGVTRLSGGAANWPDGSFWSTKAMKNSAFVQAVPNAAGQGNICVFGLSQAQAAISATPAMSNVDWSIAFGYGGSVICRQGSTGVYVINSAGYVAGDTFAISYDGITVTFYKNGVSMYSTTLGVVPNLTYYFVGSAVDITSTLTGVQLLPYTSNVWNDLGGLNKPSNNAGTTAVLTACGTAASSLVIAGNQVTRLASTGGAWVASSESFVNSCSLQFQSGGTPGGSNAVAGIILDPTAVPGGSATPHNYVQYGFLLTNGGIGWWVGYGNAGSYSGTVTGNEQLQVTYDGTQVLWYIDGVLWKTYNVGVTTGLKYNAMVALNGGGTVRNLFFTGTAVRPLWSTTVEGRPANLAALSGSEGVNNGLVSIGSNGALAGGGGGQVTIGGLGFTGDTDAQRNGRITVASGVLSGIGTPSVVVDNGYISVSAGTLLGIGTGNGTAVGNSLISIGSNGALAGGGGGQVTIGGLGFTGDTDAQRNSRITVASGVLSGIGTPSIVVDNGYITVSAGTINGIGTGNGTAIGNSLISIGANGTLAGGGGGQVTITGLGYTGALNATKNTPTYSATAPSSPTDGDIWGDTSVSPTQFKMRVGGAWQIVSNYSTNTNQLTDGANLGGTALWTGVASRPANLSALSGSEGINNASVSLSAGGALAGAGGGQILYDSLADGSTYAKVKGTDVTSGNIKLGVAGSGAKLGDARNLPAVQAANLRYKFTGAITYTAAAGTPATATISVAAGSVLLGSTSVAYNAMSVGVSGSGGATVQFFLYVDDAGYAGGSRTLVATTTATDVYSSDGRVYIGDCSVFFPSSGTGGGGGGGGGGYCVTLDMLLAGAGRASGVTVGDQLTVADPAQLEPRLGLVSYAETKVADCVRITTASGVVLDCSTIAPIGLAGGGSACATDLLGRVVVVCDDGDWCEVIVASVEPLGMRQVRHITCEDTFFLAGREANRFLLHHNAKP